MSSVDVIVDILDEETEGLSQDEMEQIAERIVEEDGRISKFDMFRIVCMSISITISIIAIIISFITMNMR